MATALLCACADLPPATTAPPPAQFLSPAAAPPGSRCGPIRPIAIGVTVSGWHSGLIVPAADLGPVSAVLSDLPAVRYVGFGWGSRPFYMAAHPSSGDALHAFFGSAGVLLIQGAGTAGELSDPGMPLQWACLDRAQLWKLDTYLSHALRRRQGRPVDLGPGPLPDSRFYASPLRYDAFHTCNTWTLAALQYAGLPVHAGGVIFAAQLLHRLARLRHLPVR